jgi:hypothetical protein
VVPLVMLVAGTGDEWHARAQIEAAEVDVALLADDLPPDAYSDAGFVEFLPKTSVNNLSQIRRDQSLT